MLCTRKAKKRKCKMLSESDFLMLILAFIVGLFVFQIRGIKKILGLISALGFILFTMGLLTSTLTFNFKNTIMLALAFILGGTLGDLVYKTGANISRYEQFGTISSKIILYIIYIALILWIINILTNIIR